MRLRATQSKPETFQSSLIVRNLPASLSNMERRNQELAAAVAASEAMAKEDVVFQAKSRNMVWTQ